MVKGFYFNRYSDLTEDKNVKYPSVFVQAKSGTISQGTHSGSFDFRMFILDRTFLSTDSNDNEADVISDCIGIAMDIVALINYTGQVNSDASFNLTSNFEIVIDKNTDVTAGIYFDFNIKVMYYQNICATPSSIIIEPDDMKEVYDIIWMAPSDIIDGIYSFPVPDDVKSKKILHVVRANFPLFRTTADNVDNVEYKYDGTTITFGTPIMPDERTLILYRQY